MKILIVSAYDDESYVVGLLNAGADGYHMKDQPLADLQLATQRVLQGERWISSSLVAKLAHQRTAAAPSTTIWLTRRQRELLRLVAARAIVIGGHEFVGQQHFLGEGKLLRRMLQADRLSSAVFYGPPGSGKTMLAKRFPTILPDLTLDEALALADELSMRPLVAHCHLGLGKFSRRTGKLQQAQEQLTTALTMYREMDMRFWLEQVQAEMRTLA